VVRRRAPVFRPGLAAGTSTKGGSLRVILAGCGPWKSGPHPVMATRPNPPHRIMRSPEKSGIRKEEEQRGCTEKNRMGKPASLRECEKESTKWCHHIRCGRANTERPA